VVGSADQLRQVMSNLVVNAKDSMPEGGQLIVRTRQVPSPDGVHGWVRIVVADTGTGIPPSVLPTVFDPFVSTKGEKGTGLGLWIVRGIVENHGGRIRLRSKPGKGTIFKLDFPVVR
jgi:signal transduction histidine kinase